jgi:hypothetical protein
MKVLKKFKEALVHVNLKKFIMIEGANILATNHEIATLTIPITIMMITTGKDPETGLIMITGNNGATFLETYIRRGLMIDIIGTEKGIIAKSDTLITTKSLNIKAGNARQIEINLASAVVVMIGEVINVTQSMLNLILHAKSLTVGT